MARFFLDKDLSTPISTRPDSNLAQCNFSKIYLLSVAVVFVRITRLLALEPATAAKMVIALLKLRYAVQAQPWSGLTPPWQHSRLQPCGPRHRMQASGTATNLHRSVILDRIDNRLQSWLRALFLRHLYVVMAHPCSVKSLLKLYSYPMQCR